MSRLTDPVAVPPVPGRRWLVSAVASLVSGAMAWTVGHDLTYRCAGIATSGHAYTQLHGYLSTVQLVVHIVALLALAAFVRCVLVDVSVVRAWLADRSRCGAVHRLVSGGLVPVVVFTVGEIAERWAAHVAGPAVLLLAVGAGVQLGLGVLLLEAGRLGLHAVSVGADAVRGGVRSPRPRRVAPVLIAPVGIAPLRSILRVGSRSGRAPPVCA